MIRSPRDGSGMLRSAEHLGDASTQGVPVSINAWTAWSYNEQVIHTVGRSILNTCRVVTSRDPRARFAPWTWPSGPLPRATRWSPPPAGYSSTADTRSAPLRAHRAHGSLPDARGATHRLHRRPCHPHRRRASRARRPIWAEHDARIAEAGGGRRQPPRHPDRGDVADALGSEPGSSASSPTRPSPGSPRIGRSSVST